jgi:hypothetical protein
LMAAKALKLSGNARELAAIIEAAHQFFCG